MELNIKLSVFLVTLLARLNCAARILAIFPVPSISHQVVFQALTHELAKRGHEVVVITTDPAFPKDEAPANLTEIDTHDMSYETWAKEFIARPQQRYDDWPANAFVAFSVISALFEKQMQVNEVKSVIFDKSEKFDLLLIESCAAAALGVSHVHKVPVIVISSFGPLLEHLRTVGAPFHVFLNPTSSHQRIGKLTIWEKINAIIYNYRLEKSYDKVDQITNEVLKRAIGPDTPSISELRKNVHMLFLNVHPLWELNRPVPPNVVYLGGLHQKPEKELPNELRSYLDSSKNGVIYISFGTNVDPSLLPSESIQTIIRVFSKLPYDVLWKWNTDELPGRTDNIKISKWLPQSDLLRHPKVKLFITQAGLQSTDEAIAAGVPMIGVPMLGDQWYNAELYEFYKIGKRLDLERITEASLTDAITSIIGDENYRKNIAKLKVIFSDAPEKPLERAVWWTEYVLRHKGAHHLVSPAANITWTEYLELELVLYLFLAFISIVISFIAFIYYVYKMFVRSSVSKTKKSS